MKTKRKMTKRRMLSIVLSVALLVSMLPPSVVQVAKAAGYPVTYMTKTGTDGKQYITLTGMTDDYADFIDSDGTLTFPDEIDGKPVKEVMGMMEVKKGKKLVLPASIDTIGKNAMLYISAGTATEVHIMCEGLFQCPAEFGFIYFVEQEEDAALTDVYFHPADISGSPTNLLGYYLGDWGTMPEAKTTVTLHVSSQTVLDKFNADEKVQTEISAGKLIIVKDLEASGDAELAAKRQLLAQKRATLTSKISKCETMNESDYTVASWSALQSTLTACKKLTEASDGEDVDEATAAVDAAIVEVDAARAGLISLTALNTAIAAAEKLNEEEYRVSFWTSFQTALAAAKAVPDDATAEKVEELRTALTQAQKNLQKKSRRTITISWEGEDSGPIMPMPKDKFSGSGQAVYGYYQDEECTTPAVGDDASKKPTQPGIYYVRATVEANDDYVTATSNVLKFTITERQVNWDEYQWDAETGELTITGDMPDFPNVLEVPWYEDMKNITAVKIKEGVTLTNMGAHAFEGAGNLQTFQIPSTVKAVGESALSGCGKLEAGVALTDVTVGENAFRNCAKLQGSVSLADTMTEVPAYSFSGSGISSVTIPEGVTVIRSRAFSGAGAIGSEGLVLPSTVRSIEANGFAYTALTSITLPEGLESIGKNAFYYCKSLEGITLPEGLESIGEEAFSGCESLEEITLPATLKELGKFAFGRTGLKQIVIPETVETIGSGLFSGCRNLYYVEILGTGYNTETLQPAQVGKDDERYDQMFDGTSPDLAVLCDGTTYDTLAGYAGTAVDNRGDTHGWPASVLHKPQEYLEGTLAAYTAEKAAASALDRADYTEATWNSLQAAIAEADALLVDGPGNYEIAAGRRAARKRLTEGVMPCLQDILNQTNAFLAGDNIEKDYDPESDSWWVLQDTMEDAGKMLEENTAGVTEIIAQIQALKTAQSGLEPRNTDTAKAALDTAITAAKELKEADYTAESWKVLQDAIAEAEALKATGTISQIEAAQKKVDDAAKALVKDNTGTQPTAKPTGDPDTQPTTKPTEDPNGGTGVQPTVQPSTKPTAKPTTKPQAPKVKKVTVKKVKAPTKKTMQVQWKKLNGVTGYQVQIGLDKNFKKGRKTYTVKKAKTTKKTIKKLKSRKKYFVRVRAYKVVNGKKYYGSWSKAKSVKVK